VSSFIQAPEDYFDAEPTFKQSYAPQSGEIFGILKQMKETFETNLSSSQKEEMANQKAYEDLKAAKEAEIAAGQEQIDTKTQELADTDEKNAQAKEDVEDTKKSLSADEEFLMMLKEKCSSREYGCARSFELATVGYDIARRHGAEFHLRESSWGFGQVATFWCPHAYSQCFSHLTWMAPGMCGDNNCGVMRTFGMVDLSINFISKMFSRCAIRSAVPLVPNGYLSLGELSSYELCWVFLRH
jgi:hypothetical protein